MSAIESNGVEVTKAISSKRKPGKNRATKSVQIASDALPRKTLQDALKVAFAIKDNYGSNGATWEDIARAMGIGAGNQINKYYLWAALAYGLIARGESATYHLSELGRKIVAPVYDGEDREGIIKAVGTPSILGRFYSDYGGASLPIGDIFKNVLEQKYSVPAARVDEAINLILENARYAKLLEELPDGRLKLVSANAAIGIGGPSQSASVTSQTQNVLEDQNSTEFSKACFVITPLGDEGSQERKHADALFKHLITPVLEEFKITPVRADKIGKVGHITKQVVEHIAFSKLCITDLSFGNQNAHYELGIRHTLRLPSIQIIKKGDKIPFDIQQGRTIVIDTSDAYTIMDRIASAKAELSEHVKSLLEGGGSQEESPITMYLPKLSVKVS
jgi:hypothetical protein